MCDRVVVDWEMKGDERQLDESWDSANTCKIVTVLEMFVQL